MKKTRTTETIGMRIKERRKRLGLSQERLGELAGVSYQQIQKYEKGINEVGIERLHKIAAILQAPVEHFFKDIQIIKEDEPIYGGMTSLEKRLLRYFRKVEDQRLQLQLIALVKVAANLKR